MRRKPILDRLQALAAVPVQTPVVKRERKSGKVYLTVEFERPGWQRTLGADQHCERTYGLDAYGFEVYSFCDGTHSVQQGIERFAKQHHISLPEAELAVTSFLQTLIKKGLIGMAVEKEVLIR